MEQVNHQWITAKIGAEDILHEIHDFPLQSKGFTVEEVVGNSLRKGCMFILEWRADNGSVSKFKKILSSPNDILITALASPFGFYSHVNNPIENILGGDVQVLIVFIFLRD